MRRYALRDDQWDRIKDLLPGRPGSVGVTAADVQLQQQSDFIASVRPLVERIEAVGIEVQAEANEAGRDENDREHEDLER